MQWQESTGGGGRDAGLAWPLLWTSKAILFLINMCEKVACGHSLKWFLLHLFFLVQIHLLHSKPKQEKTTYNLQVEMEIENI